MALTTGGTFTITWVPAENASAFNQIVEVKKTTDTLWTPYQTVSGSTTTTTVTGLEVNTLYDFKIVSICNYGGSASSNKVTLVNFACPSVLTSETDTTISYSFPHPMGSVSEITVQLVSDDETGTLSTQTPTGAEISGTFTGLAAGTPYKIRVILASDPFSKTCPLIAVTTRTLYSYTRTENFTKNDC